jgi:hypothetical protein
MKYNKIVNKGSAAFLDNIAKQENKMFIRIFYQGKFVNYLFDPADVQNLGLSNIFDMIDPDPDFIKAQQEFENFGVERAKKKQAKLAAAQ